MYGLIWRIIPGNFFVKFIVTLLLLFIAVICLMEWVFPWASEFTPLNNPATIGSD